MAIGSEETGGASFKGKIGEIVVLESVSAEGRQDLESYLAHKWGLAHHLPVSHPAQSVYLTTKDSFDYESVASSFTIRVQAKDQSDASIESNFTITLLDVYEPSKENHLLSSTPPWIWK